jgi:hypothetical protein
MSFPDKIKEEALVNSRRCCCVCHEFSGLYVNVHHILPKASGGPNTLDNSIVLCLRCHGEAGHYNPKHPIGNKYSPEELRKHRDKWWAYCESNPTKSLPTKPISISPNSFRLIAGEWKTKINLKVHNRSEEVLYDVAIKFSVRVPGVETKDIEVEPLSKNFELNQPINDIVFSGDILRLDGKDSTGSDVFVIYIHDINPKEVLTFIVDSSLVSALEPQFQQHIVISLLGFKEEPSEMLVQENAASIKFVSYENWDIASSRILLKKRQKSF